VFDVEIDVAQNSHQGAVISIALGFALKPGAPLNPKGFGSVTLPSGLHPTRCNDQRGCEREPGDPRAGAHDSQSYRVPLSYEMGDVIGSGIAKASIAIREHDLAWSQNQLSLEGELPHVDVFPDDPTPTAPTIAFSYAIPQLSRYDFTRGPQPTLALNKSSWTEPTQHSQGVLLTSGGDFAVDEADFAATDHRSEQHDGDSLFIAGALVGVAGGALVGSLQEAIRR
jgi:hypothetical protein